MKSAWIEPNDPKPPFQGDAYTVTETSTITTESTLDADIIDPERLGLEYPYHLQMKALKLDWTRNTIEKPFLPVEGLMEGNDGVLNPTDDTWYIPAMDTPDESFELPMETYDDMFQHNNIIINRCDEPAHKDSMEEDVTAQIQSNTGANTNITSDISVLDDVQWVQPVNCDSAKKGATISIQAIGKYLIRRTTITINMYYSPDVTGTIISPTTIVHQNTDKFVGYQKYMNLDDEDGHILLVAWEGANDVTIPLYQANDLCYHCQSHYTLCPKDIANGLGMDNFNRNFTINRLSDAAKWELWHQHLAHPGNCVTEQQYKHADGIPPLKGNTFYWCLSCMPNKLCTKRSGKHRNLGDTLNETLKNEEMQEEPHHVPDISHREDSPDVTHQETDDE